MKLKIPTSNEIVYLTKDSFSSFSFTLEILTADDLKKRLQLFPFQNSFLYVDCDEDAFLEVSPQTQKEASKGKPIWKEGKLLISKSELDEEISQYPNLVPFLAQDENGKDLMLAWGKRESLLEAFQTGLGTYFSRSRNNRWVKGEESGHLQHLIEVTSYQNPFFIRYIAKQTGAACHTGSYSCFFRKVDSNLELSLVQ